MQCDYCGNLQSPGIQFCADCGAELISPEQLALLEQANSSGDFVQRIYKHGSSSLFLAGCIMYTIGSVLGILITLSFATIISIWFVIIPVIAAWKIYTVSTGKASVEGILSSLKMFKVITMIPVVLLWIAVGAMAIVAVAFIFIEPIIFVAFVVAILILLVYIIFYFFALFKIINSIRNGIATGHVAKIEGVGAFTILSFIIIGISLLGNIFVLLGIHMMDMIVENMLYYFEDFVGSELMIDLVSDFGGLAVLSSLIGMVTNIGMLLLIITLRKFAMEVRYNLSF